MEIGLIGVVAVVLLVGTSILGARIGVAAPLLLVVLGIGLGYLPFVPAIALEPEIILLGVLPPLLYAAAVNVPLVDFRRNFRPVAGLSVLLVIISAVIIGYVIHLALPAIPLPVGIALGAVVSPTDAVAATSIGKRLGMPDRVVSILEGESLVNDATSLVLLKTSLAAIAGSFVFWDAAGSFLLSVTLALIIGGLMGLVTVWLRSKLRNPVYDTIISFVVPFVAFIPAEAVHASGVLAVVVTGLYTGHHAARRFSAVARMNERLNWRTVQFVLENGVFLVMGLQLHTLVDEVKDSRFQLHHVTFLALAIVAILIVCRAVFMIPMIASMRVSAARNEQREAGVTRVLRNARRQDNARKIRRAELFEQRFRADLEHERDQRLGWRDGAVLSWSGMRGVVTLAAAQSIPTEIPFRPQLILVAFLVAVMTLLLHGLTLPFFIRKLWPDGAGTGTDMAELASLSNDLIEAANEAMDDAVAAEKSDPGRTPTPEKVVDRARASARNALAPIAVSLKATGPIGAQSGETPAQAYLRLARVALEAQRTALLEERAIGRYSSRALRAAELALDAHEARLSPPMGM